MIDLTLTSVDDMIQEIQRRHDSILVVTNKILDKDEDETIVVYNGGRASCIGLAVYAKEFILNDIDE